MQATSFGIKSTAQERPNAKFPRPGDVRCPGSGSSGHFSRCPYVYLVESVYQDGRTRQHIIRNLGRREDVEARGDLERLAASAARLGRTALVLSAEARGAAPVLGCRRIGPGLIFERLWTETGCRAVIEAQARDRRFGFALWSGQCSWPCCTG